MHQSLETIARGPGIEGAHFSTVPKLPWNSRGSMIPCLNWLQKFCIYLPGFERGFWQSFDHKGAPCSAAHICRLCREKIFTLFPSLAGPAITNDLCLRGKLRYFEFQGNGENTLSFPKFEIANNDVTQIHVHEQKYVHFRKLGIATKGLQNDP